MVPDDEFALLPDDALGLPSDLEPTRCDEPASHCGRCQQLFLDLEPKCNVCGAARGTPNVLAASERDEQIALRRRVRQVLDDALERGCHDACLRFARAVQRSAAVVNVDVDTAKSLFKHPLHLYTPYGVQVDAGMRSPAESQHDQRRRSVDGALFGSYGSRMRCAALSLDGRGLASYGPVTLELTDVSVAARASVLEENSYDFTARHRVGGGRRAPHGFRAPWATRHLVALAKLGGRVRADADETAIARLLIEPATRRADDQFIEVHLWEGFDYRAVRRVRMPAKPSPEASPAELESLREVLRSRGIPIEEE